MMPPRPDELLWESTEPHPTSVPESERAHARAIDEGRRRMIEAIAVVDGAATALSAPLLSPGELDAAHSLHESIAALPAEGMPARLPELSDRLHRLLVSRCPNRRLSQLLDEELTLLHSITPCGEPSPGSFRRTVDDHGELLALVRRGADVDTFTRLLLRHRRICH